MNATEQYFPVVLFNTLYKVALTFESVAQYPPVSFSVFYEKEFAVFCSFELCEF